MALRVEVKNLHKTYGQKCAVEDVSLSLESGKVFSIIGRNGSGKTSTIRMMLGTLAKDSGEVLVDGKRIDALKENVGYLPEERGLLQKDSIREQLRFLASLKKVDSSKFEQQFEYWMNRLELNAYKNMRIEQLSKGNQQKVQIVASLIHDPEIVILDEPFSGLDPVNAELLIELIKEMKEQNKCVLVSSHQLSFVEAVCDDVLIIDNSKVLFSGSVEQLKEQYGEQCVLIQTKSDLSRLEQYAPSRISENLYSIAIGENLRDLLNLLIANNIEFEKIERKDNSLHEIFVKLTTSNR